MVAQYYDTDVNKEYVIRGNSAILKCQIPSFVADFIEILSWHTDQDETFKLNEKYGLLLFFRFIFKSSHPFLEFQRFFI